MAAHEIETAGFASGDPAQTVTTSLLDPGRGERSYQDLFRAIGSMLDGDATGAISIVEVNDGFLLRAQRITPSKMEQMVTHLSYPALQSYADNLRQLRPGSRLHYHPGIWNNFSVTLQDALRALGHELDSIGARNVVVDEVSDGLVLFSQHAKGWRLTLGKAEIEAMLEEAVRRRTAPADAKAWEFSRVKRDMPGEPAPQGFAPDWKDANPHGTHHDQLRAIGRALDQHDAAHVCLLQAPDGIVLRYQRSDGQLVWTRFVEPEIPVGGPDERQKTRVFRRSEPAEPGRYSDLFRVLGAELRRLGAFDLLILEQDDGVAAAYQFRDPQHQMKPRRTALFLETQWHNELVQQARARRQPETGLRARIARY